MFKDSYKADNEKIKPDNAELKHLAYKMGQETQGKTPWKRRIVSAVAITAACVAVVFGASNVLNNFIRFETGMNLVNTEEAQTDVTYDDLYRLVKTMQRNTQASGGFFDWMNGAAGDTADGAAESGTNLGGGMDETDFSGTNLQVEGVDEADIIKTDGKYIYALTATDLVIVEVDGAEMKLLSKINREELSAGKSGENVTELYLKENRLILVAQEYAYAYDTGDVMPEGGGGTETSTRAVIYDISDRANPKPVGSVGQSGYCLSTRMVGNVLYMVTNHTIYNGTVRRDAPETYVPTLYTGETKTSVSAADICVSASPQSMQYIVLSSFDTAGSGAQLATKSVFGCGNTIYANAENLLIASGTARETALSERETKYSYDTNLIRFSLNEGQIGDAVFGTVPGTLLNQFSMDEHNGNFRVVTTVRSYTETRTPGGGSSEIWSSSSNQDSTNALYILGQDLKIVGKVENLAPGEQVYSVRFDGDVGYFVTFRQVDPLFTVDLSNPAAPVILNALKIPGFSEYLHPYSDGLLFGFGKDADEESGAVNGLKLSMFNTSNPNNVTEQHKLLLEQAWSEASYNHKAILVSPQRGLIAFPADSSYLVFSYSDEKGFTELGELKQSADMHWNEMRGLYIDDCFYIFSTTGLSVFSLNSFELLSSLRFG